LAQSRGGARLKRARADMAKAKQPPGPPVDLGNMRRLGVHHLIASCLNNESYCGDGNLSVM